METKIDITEPSEYTGRLRVDNSEESGKAIGILCDAGFRVNIVPVSGTIGPELTVGSKIYYGLSAITNLIQVKINNK